MSEIFDDRRCELGEGPLWHPERGQLYWFDILNRQLLTREAGRTRVCQFAGHVSAAGWVDDTSLLIASDTRLFLFDLEREKAEDIEALEAGNPRTRSNDGRADPWGGFWIGTMAKDAEGEQGAIYRWYDGKLTRLFDRISIPNAICFSPDRSHAYYADTPTQKIMRQPLDAGHGWPEGAAEVWLDLSPSELFPDGAVVDADGNLWNAQWGAGRVAVYGPDGDLLRTIPFAAPKTTCPAFGGPGLTTLFCTSAGEEMPRDDDRPHGATFAAPEAGRGQAEHRVRL